MKLKCIKCDYECDKIRTHSFACPRCGYAWMLSIEDYKKYLEEKDYD